MDKKKGIFSSIGNWFKRLFYGPNKEISAMQVDKLETPFVTVLKRFFAKKTALIATITFIIILLLVFLAPYFYPIDVNYRSTTQSNKKPGYNYLSVPSALNSAKMISIGPSYGIGIDQDGKVHIWGDTKLSKYVDLKDIPNEVLNDKIEWVSAGADFIIAVAESGKLYGWGQDILGQYGIGPAVPLPNYKFCNKMYWDSAAGFKAFGKEIKSIESGYQVTFVNFTDGSVYAWGNQNDWPELPLFRGDGNTIIEGDIVQLAVTLMNSFGITSQGKIKNFGSKEAMLIDARNATDFDQSKYVDGYYGVDINDYIGDRKAVAVGATDKVLFVSLDDGTLLCSGGEGTNLLKFPKNMGKIVKFVGGERHVYAINEEGKVFSWGDDDLDQINMPNSVKSADFSDNSNRLYAGYNGTVFISKENNVTTWGLRGYLLGTDSSGRDVFIRLLNGGNRTLTIGAMAVLIASFIGIVVGIVAGYFGGWIDLLLMRVAEVINSLPVLPFALILSAVLGSSVSEDQRMYIIMVVMGVLTWPGLAGLVRGQVLAEREKDFVLAAKAMGVRERGIAFRHILPNIMSVILVTMTLGFASGLLTESSLSYLGFGVREPVPTWGNMLTKSNGATAIEEYWWQWVFPSLMLGISVISINLIGDGMRDAIDPKSAER